MQIMNESGWNDTESYGFIGSDVTHIKDHIERVFVDAWRKAVTICPKTYFTIKDFSSNKIIPDISQGNGYIVLPDDFYEIVSFKMKGWQVACEVLTKSSDPIARLQANKYTRGNICRPVCVRNNKSIKERDGDDYVYSPKEVLQYYSLSVGSIQEIEEAFYIPMVDSLKDNPKINEKLFIPLAYLCASFVYSIFEKLDIAKALESKATEIIN